jgi:hypothetical protein
MKLILKYSVIIIQTNEYEKIKNNILLERKVKLRDKNELIISKPFIFNIIVVT